MIARRPRLPFHLKRLQQQSLFTETYPNMDVIRTPHYNKLTYGRANYMPMVERGLAMVVEVIQPPPTRRRRGVCPFRLRPPLLRSPPPSGTHSTGEGGRGAYPRDHWPFITNYMSRGGTATRRGCNPSISRAGRASYEPAPASPAASPRPRSRGGVSSRDLSRPTCQTQRTRRR